VARIPRILIVDDDRGIRDLVSGVLGKHGFRTVTARDGVEMKASLAENRIDLVVLDLMLPGRNGLELCRELRARSAMPIIILTAIGEEADRVAGLEIGADDYIAKPFSPRELLARIRAVLRRLDGGNGAAEPGRSGVLRFAGWSLDRTRRRLEAPDGVVVGLTSGEFDLLAAFVEHPQRILSRDRLLDLTRGRDLTPFDRSIDVQVSRLRKKIEPDADGPKLIVTVRGDGYMFTSKVEAE
jgi:two-component system OmpR family response regulator